MNTNVRAGSDGAELSETITRFPVSGARGAVVPRGPPATPNEGFEVHLRHHTHFFMAFDLWQTLYFFFTKLRNRGVLDS
jgi:hypothetical protein